MEEYDEELPEPTPEDIADIFDYMIEMGYMKVVGLTEDGVPLYKFSAELLAMPEFYAIHEQITNDILFNIWNKGYIEMNPVDEDGNWNISLNEKSHDKDSAYLDLDESEYALFCQIYQELSAEKGYN